MMFGGLRIDAAVVRELIRAVEPMAVEAAVLAERKQMERQAEQRRILELELQQARYEASLAERRYAACDPDNRLIAATLEKGWEAALRRIQDCELRLDTAMAAHAAAPKPDFPGIAEDLETAWKTPSVTMRTRQQLLRTLVNEITADLDEEAREIVLTIHWKGGQHSQLRLRKPRSGEHDCSTPDDALAVIRSMATRWSDEDIAATLNRMRLPTGQGKTWTAHRVSSIRRVRGIRAYRSAEKHGVWLTMREAAQHCGVTSHRIRRLIQAGVLPAEQVVPGAPYQIRAADLQSERVVRSMGRKGRPCHLDAENQIPMFTDT
jgi:excisionase family DNA binding protein